MKHDPLDEALERASREAPTAEARLAATDLLARRRERTANAKPRCGKHPAYEADYCPSCGTSRVIGAGAGEPGFGDDRDLVAWDRAETDPCQKGTPGCAVNHKADGPEQECLPW